MASIEEVLGDDLLEKILAEVEDYQTLLNLGGTNRSKATDCCDTDKAGSGADRMQQKLGIPILQS
jgi:hypothetical protein